MDSPDEIKFCNRCQSASAATNSAFCEKCGGPLIIQQKASLTAAPESRSVKMPYLVAAAVISPLVGIAACSVLAQLFSNFPPLVLSPDWLQIMVALLTILIITGIVARWILNLGRKELEIG